MYPGPAQPGPHEQSNRIRSRGFRGPPRPRRAEDRPTKPAFLSVPTAGPARAPKAGLYFENPAEIRPGSRVSGPEALLRNIG